MISISIILFGIVVLLTHFLEGITGFGCTVIAMPFAIMLLGIDIAKPVLTLYGLLLCLYIVIISYKEIIWKHYFTIIIFMGIGLPIGIYLFDILPEGILKKLLAIFMVFVSIRGLIQCYRPAKTVKSVSNVVLKLLLSIGGVIHGAFTSGGPLVIIYATEKIKNKSNFRATLCLVWVTLNTVLLTQTLLVGSFTPKVCKTSIYALPFLILGTLLGNWAHSRIKDTFFSKLSYIILLVTGFILLM